jgi:hypothetical protein
VATRFLVLYRDGSEAEGWLTPRALLAYERKYGGQDGKRLEGTYFAAYTELRPGVDFDQWIDTVQDLTEETADPRQATQPEPSLLSPPQPDSTPES